MAMNDFVKCTYNLHNSDSNNCPLTLGSKMHFKFST